MAMRGAATGTDLESAIAPGPPSDSYAGTQPYWNEEATAPAPRSGDRRKWALVCVGLCVAIVLSATSLYLVLDRPASSSGPPSGLPSGVTVLNQTVAFPAMGWEPSNRTVFVGYTAPNGTWNNVFNMTWYASGPVYFAWGKFYPSGTLFYPCYGFSNCSSLWMPALSSQSDVSGWGSSSECCGNIVGVNRTSLEVWNYGNTSVQFTYHAWWNYSTMPGGWPVGSNAGSFTVPPVVRTPQWSSFPFLQDLFGNGTLQWHVELSGPDCVGYLGNFSLPAGPYDGMNPNATAAEVYIPGPGTWVRFTGTLDSSTMWFGPSLELKCDSLVAVHVVVYYWSQTLTS